MPIGAFITIKAKPGCADELFRLTEEVIVDVRTEPGNLFAVTLRDPKEPDTVFLFEIYRDEAAIQEHSVAKHTVDQGPKIHALFETFNSRRFETLDWPEGFSVSY